MKDLDYPPYISRAPYSSMTYQSCQFLWYIRDFMPLANLYQVPKTLIKDLSCPHGRIRPDIELDRHFMPVAIVYKFQKNKKIKNEISRLFTRSSTDIYNT